MNRPLSHSLILRPMLFTLVLLCSHCEKKDDAAAQTSPAPQKQATPAKPASMTDHAAKLGFAAKLPLETEIYLGSVNFKAHLTGLKNSAWWKDVNAIVQDNTPAPTAGDKSMAVLEKLWGDDVFLAGAQGFAQSAAQLRDFNRVYNEINFKMLMTGGALGGLSGSAQGVKQNPLLYLQTFLQDPAMLEKAAGVITAFELPPLIAGFKVEKPDEVLAVLNDTRQLEEKKIFAMSDLTTPQGQKFRVATIEMLNLLPEADQQAALAKLPSDTPEQSRKVIEKAYDDLQGKKFMLAWGTVDGHLILACGKNLDHLKFAASPAQSLLAKPELAWLLPHAEKNLAAITYMSAGALNAIHDDQPFVPMLRGVVSAMKENPMFKGLGEALDKQIAELSPLESKAYTSEATNLVAGAWWDRGLHVEFTGGFKPRFMLPDKPLRFHQLVDRPGVVFGLAYQRNQEHEKIVRAWVEKLIGVAYTAAQELIKAGIAGKEGGQSFAMFELMLLPTIQKIYQADKDMDQKGLGSEIAYILDVNGKMPQLPGVPATAKDMPFPRLTSASEVASRAELAKGWTTINETVTNVATIASAFGGQPSGPQAKPPFVMPQPQSSTSGDMTTWFYTGEMFSGDLNPCASISDKLLVLSTSKNAAESFAADLSKPVEKKVEGAVWKLDLGAAADWIAKASALAPTQTPEKAKALQQSLKWIKPFHAMDGHLFQEKGQWRGTLNWEITDVVKFD